MESLLKMTKKFEVYICKKDGHIIYIGEGLAGRHKHCNSGTSHVYGLNKLHFEGHDLEVDVVKVFSSKKEAEQCEKALIEEYQPMYNTKGRSDYKPIHLKATEIRDKIKALRDDIIHDLQVAKVSNNRFQDTLKILDEFLGYFGNEDFLKGNYKLRGYGYYSGFGLSGLHRLMRYIATKDCHIAPIWVEVLFKNTYIHTGVNMSDRLYSKTKEVDDYWKEFIVKNDLVFLGHY